MAPGNIKGKFTENEKLLCYHGPLLYEAKCIKLKKDNANAIQYFIHYQGWNKNWDEWVPESRILKINPENLDKKQKLLSEHYAGQSKSKKSKAPPSTPSSTKGGKSSGGGSANTSRASTPVSERSFKVTPATKRGPNAIDDDRSTSSREEESKRSAKRTRLSESLLDDSEAWKFRIDIPEELKYVLVSDMELITHKKLLFGLPAKIPVSNILSEYVKHVEKEKLDNISMISEVMSGMKDMLDGLLRSNLLYKSEIPQYSEKVLKGNLTASNVYGSAHLLRLMVHMGPFLNNSNMDTSDESNVELIESIINNFLLYLEANHARLFTSKNYTQTAEEYIKREEIKTE